MKIWNPAHIIGIRWPTSTKDTKSVRDEEAAGETRVYQKQSPVAVQRQYRIEVTNGRDCGREFLLAPTMMKIGRQPDCFIRLSDRKVSREHAILQYKAREKRYILEDAQSTNGTFLNGRRIRREYIRSGDEIRVGETVMRFLIVEPDGMDGMS